MPYWLVQGDLTVEGDTAPPPALIPGGEPATPILGRDGRIRGYSIYFDLGRPDLRAVVHDVWALARVGLPIRGRVSVWEATPDLVAEPEWSPPGEPDGVITMDHHMGWFDVQLPPTGW